MGCVVIVIVVQIENEIQIFLHFNTVFLILFHNTFQKHQTYLVSTAAYTLTCDV